MIRFYHFRAQIFGGKQFWCRLSLFGDGFIIYNHPHTNFSQWNLWNSLPHKADHWKLIFPSLFFQFLVVTFGIYLNYPYSAQDFSIVSTHADLLKLVNTSSLRYGGGTTATAYYCNNDEHQHLSSSATSTIHQERCHNCWSRNILNSFTGSLSCLALTSNVATCGIS